MSIRALDLLELEEGSPSLILDIGCGSGLSGEILEQEGHVWVGMDISPSMLEVALERESDGDLLLADIGSGIPFRAGSFDGAISISVLQWLLNADTADANPIARLTRFFGTLYSSLRRGAKAIFQFYPENDKSMNIIMQVATKCGFGGGVVIDNPDSKKTKKYYLCLQVGGGTMQAAASSVAGAEAKGLKAAMKRGKKELTTKGYILKKKELYRKRGKVDVPLDSKYTGRKRKIRF